MIDSIEEGRKEDGNRSIAKKIKDRLDVLRKTVESNYGRWAWELLQNAKDSISSEDKRTVSIDIELNEDSVVFKHNGLSFTDLDIRGLINQISSKEVEEGVETKNTGRFGTGFLTTHLLSKKVEITGIVQAEEGLHNFHFLLDRDAATTDILAQKVEASWSAFQTSTKLLDTDYDDRAFNTSFKYFLESESQKSIAKRGLTEFLKLIPFVLAFIPKIQDVTIKVNKTNRFIKFENTREVLDDILIKIKKTNNSNTSNILIAVEKNDKVSIATEVEEINGKYSIKGVENIPKIFCDFPLIGTEKFHFPVIVNSFSFSPQTERDGIWLKGSDEDVIINYELLELSVELFKTLLTKISKKEYSDLYNIAITKIPYTDEKHFDKDWYIENIQKPLRAILMQSEIVETSSDRGKLEEVYFPDTTLSKEPREKIWQFSFDLKVNKLPIKEHIQKWADVVWAECKKVDIDDLVNDLKGKENISELEKTLDMDKSQTFEWLSECLTFIKEHDEYNYPSYEIIPNQKEVFKSHKSLSLDEIDDEELKKIANQVGYNYYEILVHRDLFYKLSISEINMEMIASKITTLINEENDTEDRKQAITMLIEWFENNNDKGKEYFLSLYNKKEKLLVDTIPQEEKESLFALFKSGHKMSEVVDMINQDPAIITSNIKKANELDTLYKEFGVNSVDELKKLIASSPRGNVAVEDIAKTVEPIEVPKKATSEVLASLGITSVLDFEIAKKSHPELFHENVPTKEMYEAAQVLIERAMKNIENHLKTLDEYICEDIEPTAPTILGGIVKYAQDISIVARPSDSGKIVIGYYESEIPVLELDGSELWYENGSSTPKRMTLGKMLKTTNITRIPV